MTSGIFGLQSELGQFLGSYLGQDFDITYPDPWSAVEAYVEEAPQLSRMVARVQLQQVLAACGTETELSAAMDRLRMNLHPPGMGLTYREWLTKVERYLADHETS